VLITRPEPGATETARRVAALDLVPVVASVTVVRNVPAELPDPEQLQAVLVASGNAIDALPQSHRSLKLLAVGDATAARARRAGHVAVHSAAGDAIALAELTARQCDPTGLPLLLAAGRGQGERLAATLTGLGFQVVHRAIYAVEPVRVLPETTTHALRDAQLRAALFFSAETARIFVRLVRNTALANKLDTIDALAISTATVAALSPLQWRRVRAALRPNHDDLLALLQ
jgi:uroporphyrinogen-III synthase